MRTLSINSIRGFGLVAVGLAIALITISACSNDKPAPETSEVSSTETYTHFIPLYRAKNERGNDAVALVYRSEPLSQDTNPSPSAESPMPQLRNWDCSYSLTTADGTTKSIEPDGRLSALKKGEVLEANVRYTGKTKLIPKTLDAVAPRFLLVPAGMTKPAQPKNVLIVMIDTLRQDHTSAYGHPNALTPHLDLIRASGARFDNAYAPSSSTRPSVGSLMTGYYPLAHGSVRSCTMISRLHDGAPRLAVHFKKNGFNTAGFYANGQVSAACGFAVGFDDYDGPVWDAELSFKGLRWIDSIKAPWLLYLHYIAPHHPYEPPEPYDAIFDGLTADNEYNRYLGEIAVEDARVGMLLEGIARRGLWNDTLIWIVSDHGEEFWEHGWKWHGASLYDEVTRVVSLVSCPWLIPPGLAIEEPHSLIDMPATLYSVFNFENILVDQGQNVLSLLRGESSSQLAERTLYLQLYAGTEDVPHKGDRQGLLRDQKKTVWRTTPDAYELYDLKQDANEKRDLWNNPDTPREALQNELRQFMQECQTHAERFKNAKQLDLPEMSAEDIESLEAGGYL